MLPFGIQYVEETMLSIRTLRTHNPEIPVTVFTDEEFSNSFHDVTVLPAKNTKNYEVKIQAMISSPYERTLFLDTDTYILGAVGGIFDHLQGNDVCRLFGGWATNLA